jgi:hypothetical protein
LRRAPRPCFFRRRRTRTNRPDDDTRLPVSTGGPIEETRMASVIQTNFRLRKSFGCHFYGVETPNLIDI